MGFILMFISLRAHLYKALYKLNITEKEPFKKATELKLEQGEDTPNCIAFHPEVITCLEKKVPELMTKN